MGLGDRLKGLRDQAAQSVSEHKDQIQGAVHEVGQAANVKTHGKYADKIARFDQKATQAVDRMGDSAQDEPGQAAPGPADAAGPDQEEGVDPA